MKTGFGFGVRWQVAAVGIQVAVVGACAVVGWQVMHPSTPPGAVSIKPAASAPAPGPVAASTLLSKVAGRPSPPSRPTLADVIGRVNRDDSQMYRGQWATLQLVAASTRDYLTNHVVPLLLSAARGAAR